MATTDSVPQQSLLAQALVSTANAIFIADDNAKIVWANAAFMRLSGYAPDEILGSTPSILKSGKQDPGFYAQLWKSISSGNSWRGELVNQRKDGSLYTADETITPLFDEHGKITHFIAIQHDITDQKRERERFRHLAYHDLLTDLPNRAHFFRDQQQAIMQARRSGRMLAILFIDLDKFKPVNDSLGHQIGDQLLSAVADRLRAAVRQADLLARVGGDEFAILLHDLPDSQVAIALAGKLVEALARPFVVHGQKIVVSASIGIAFYPGDGDDAQAVLAHADQAMYQAKCAGGNSFQVYDTSAESAH